jgi:predicted KAP-like P-loop ATPase
MQSQSDDQDRPILNTQNDLLDRSGLVKTIVETLVRQRRDQNGALLACEATGLVVGLTGPWGSGKSSILNLVHEALSSEARIISVKFNPWIFKDRDDLLDRFF